MGLSQNNLLIGTAVWLLLSCIPSLSLCLVAAAADELKPTTVRHHQQQKTQENQAWAIAKDSSVSQWKERELYVSRTKGVSGQRTQSLSGQRSPSTPRTRPKDEPIRSITITKDEPNSSNAITAIHRTRKHRVVDSKSGKTSKKYAYNQPNSSTDASEPIRGPIISNPIRSPTSKSTKGRGKGKPMRGPRKSAKASKSSKVAKRAKSSMKPLRPPWPLRPRRTLDPTTMPTISEIPTSDPVIEPTSSPTISEIPTFEPTSSPVPTA